MSSSVSSLLKRATGVASRQTLAGSVGLSINNMLGKSTYPNIGLNENYPNVPNIEEQTYEPCSTTVSTLPNGLRVVSRTTHDPIINIGLFVDAGSRYCTSETSGISHFLESLSVEGTQNINPQRFAENLSRTGSGLMAQAFRDCMIYQCETFKKNAPFALESIAELIWNPKIDSYRLEAMYKEYLYRIGDNMRDPEIQVPEYMHQAAYQGNTIGLPLFADARTVRNITSEAIAEYISIFYQPSRMICVGVGLEHSELEQYALDTFGSLENNPQYSNIEHQRANYTGGSLKFKYDFEDNTVNHIALIFETENWLSSDLMALCVLNMIMGGGGSFSAGGPGKGMYTRLYRDILGTYPWINHISCSHSIFSDTGLFCFYGCTLPDYSDQLSSIMIKEALNMYLSDITKKELDRAKKSLASNICFEFENRQIVFEDIARQINVYGNHQTPDMWKEKIFNVTPDDIKRVAKKLLSSKPTILALGPDVGRVPNSDEIHSVIKDAI